MKIVTFNLRCVYEKDGINSFIHRAIPIFDKIAEEKPDVIGFQEVTAQNLKILEKLLTDYIFTGQYRSENYDGEGLYTAVRKDTCQILGFETIWLSPTPYVPGSRYENQSEYPRICVQTMVRHLESGKVMRVFNLHLDHISEEAKVTGMRCAFDFIDSFENKGNHPVVILGDFNAHPDSDTIKLCNSHSGIKEATSDIEASFHDFGKKRGKIDYIFISDELYEKSVTAEVWEDVHEGIYLSDHYPIAIEFKL